MRLLSLVVLGVFCFLIIGWYQKNRPNLHPPIILPPIDETFADAIADVTERPFDLEDISDLNPNDSQNVHGRTIKRGVRRTIEQLIISEANHPSLPTDQALNEIFEYLFQEGEKIALGVLLEITERDAHYSSGGIAEKELIRLIWARINHPINRNKVKELQQSFAQQLTDCWTEHKSLCCCEGRITRLIQTLEARDAEDIVNLVPLWAIRSEMEDYCHRYQTYLLNKLEKPKYQQYNIAYQNNDSPTIKEQVLLKELETYLQEKLLKKFNHRFFETSMINQKELNLLTHDLFQYLI